MWSSNHFFTSSCSPRFSRPMFFRVQVFQGPGPVSGFRFQKQPYRKEFTRNLRDFLYEKSLTYNSYKFSYPFFIEPKIRIRFSASLSSDNQKYFCFCLYRVAFYFQGTPNSIYFHNIFFYYMLFLFVLQLHNSMLTYLQRLQAINLNNT